MDTYGKILLIAMPAFLLLVIIEKWYGWYKGRDTVRTMDMISSLSSGVTNATKDVLGLSILIISYGWLVGKVAIWHIHSTWLTYVIAFVVIDFAGYWVHRWSHQINLFWNLHIVHHGSEDFNLACALRQSITMFINPFTIVLLPAALLGVPAGVMAVVGPLQLFAQFWYHTQHIGKLGVWEKIIVTPSHHRVHHAINKEYIDKNLSQIFIFWDKLFGTYQDELPSAPAVFGITRPVQTWNPIKINFQHFWLLTRDTWYAKNLQDKWQLWFKRTGYRPADVAEKYPVHKIEDVYNFEKYHTRASNALTVWSLFQLLTILLLISYLFGNIALINKLNPFYIYAYGAFVFASVYAYTELMDRNTYAILWEGSKNLYGMLLIVLQGDWFGSALHLPWMKYALFIYFIASSLVTTMFVYQHKKEDAFTAGILAAG